MSSLDRLWDLLAAQATCGLSHDQQAELDWLLAQHPEVAGDELEWAAAAADLAMQEPSPEALPQDVHDRIRSAGLHLMDEREAGQPVAAAYARDKGEATPPAGRGGFLTAAGWLAAAAVLVFFMVKPQPVDEPAAIPTADQQRQALMASAGDAIQVAWAPPEEEAFRGVAGDVVWSSRQQAGFMRLRGMPVNDPRQQQYQLWIVDPGRDARPVDGGVFDITGEGEVIVPIDAKLPIGTPAVFAITLEQPGGVVVSDGPLLVIAPVAS